MPFPAARLTDMVVCPAATGPVPHVGGPIAGPGQPNVLIGKMPAARIGDMTVCVGPPGVIAVGSPTVIVGGKPLARLTSTAGHGGLITGPGCPTVIVP